VVVNIESTVESIKKAVEEAELMAAVQINSVYTGIAGSHISGENTKGVVALKKQEVTREDIQRAVESARTLAVIPHDRRILHVLPREFMVDEQDGVREPLGMSGNRLEVNVHVITGAVTSAQNIIKSVNRAGLDVVDIILQPLASRRDHRPGDFPGWEHPAYSGIADRWPESDERLGDRVADVPDRSGKNQNPTRGRPRGIDRGAPDGGRTLGRRSGAEDLLSAGYRRDHRAPRG
jgi:hypothetical protein